MHYVLVNVFKGNKNLKPRRPEDSWNLNLNPNAIEGLG
jgi:hypothetical protein